MVEFRVGERADWADVRAVLQAKRSFQREVSPVRQVRRAVLQAELSFQRDTTLCKRYNACKVWYPCKSGGIAVKTEPTTHDAPGFVGATRKTGTTGLDLPHATGPGGGGAPPGPVVQCLSKAALLPGERPSGRVGVVRAGS